MGFITAVDLGRSKECKNPLDHVYGLLRFAGDIDVEFRERIPIDLFTGRSYLLVEDFYHVQQDRYQVAAWA
jgi:hypothetical protein